MNAPNGNAPGNSPLGLSKSQRIAALRRIGLGEGWMLLTLAEMIAMKRAMDGSTAENLRLNGQTADLVARWIIDQQRAVDALNRAKKLLESLSASAFLPIVVVQEAINELALVNADLEHFAAHPVNATGIEKRKEG